MRKKRRPKKVQSHKIVLVSDQPQEPIRIEGIDALILGVKAMGGYKFRERINFSDEDMKKFGVMAEQKIRFMALRLEVAEEILRSNRLHLPRWEEYIEKIKEAQEEKR